MARRPIPFRIRIALAGLAGLGLAWLIPKGGGTPAPMPTPTASDLPGVTAVEVPLDLIPEGVSFHEAGGVRVFLTRSGSTIAAIIGVSTSDENGPLWWCRRNASFEDDGGDVRYDREGRILLGTAPRELDRVRVLVAANRVTIFPKDVISGVTPQNALPGERLPAPCSATERLG